MTFCTDHHRHNARQSSMAPQDPEEVKCEQFLKKLEYQADPTWGFYVYGTYARPKEQEDTGHEERDAPEAAGNTETY